MSDKRGAIRLGQGCLLLLAALLLYHWWKVRPPVMVSDDQVDDLIEQVGDTYVPVHEGKIERGTLRQYVTVYGTVAPAPAIGGHEGAGAKISFPSAAVVASVGCSEGQVIKKGDTLFTLDSRLIGAAIEQSSKVFEADAAATKPFASSQPSTQPWEANEGAHWVAADQASMEVLRIQKEMLTVRAPIDGTVTNLAIAPGSTITPTKAAVEIIDLDRLVVTVDVPAEDLGKLKPGQAADIDLRSGNATTQPVPISGTVLLVDSTVDAATGTGSADISLPATSGLRPGQLVHAQIAVGEEMDRLFVPTQAITQNQNGDPAIGKVETDDRWAWLVPVRTGWRDGDKIEIEAAGLDAEQPIVTSGANGLVQRTRLHVLKD